MSKKHNNKNYEAKNEVVEEEIPVEEVPAEDPVVEEATTVNEESVMEESNIIEGEVVRDENHEHRHHRKKHHHYKHHAKKNKKFHIDGKKAMKNIKDAALDAAYIASTCIVVGQCCTNPVSAVALVVKEGLGMHFMNEARKESVKQVHENARAEFEREAAVVGPAA